MIRKTLNEFKQFIARGNVMDLAVGIIIGAAFTAIVSSLVDDLINPIIGFVVGGMDFSNLMLRFGSGEHAATLRYGAFITAVINFLIIAWVVFLLVKGVNKLRETIDTSKKEPDAPAGPTQEELLGEIRDLLKQGVATPAIPAQPSNQSPT